MKLKDLIKTDNKTLQNKEIKGVTASSANVQKDFIFVCIKGTKFDGHNFAKQANTLGAAAIVCEKDLGLNNQIIVPDTREAYFNLSANWFGCPAKDIKIIGVTGTNGKTSVAFMLKQILETAGKKVGLIGTINNIIGDQIISSKNTTPDAYELNSMLSLMKESGCEYLVMEVSSHAIDQKRICGLEFEVAAFTNLTQDHLDYHGTMENYFLTKTKLFNMCKTAVVNYDDSYSRRLLEIIPCEKVTFSTKSEEATFTAKDIKYYPDSIKFFMSGYNYVNKISVGTGGKFTIYNALCAASIAEKLGVTPEIISSALSEMHGVKGRAEVVPTNSDFTVVIDYAHTPDGLKNILNTFKDFEACRLVVLFGCGGDRDKTKRPIMGEIAANLADFVIVTSDNPRSEEPMSIIDDILVGVTKKKTPYKVIENRIEAINYAVANAQKNDIIVLAGKGHETYQILKDKTIHLDEREVVFSALKLKKES